MIVFHALILTLHLLFGQIQSESNIGQNYDTNDWIPIESTNRRGDGNPQQVAQGRVLNLEAPPSQRFFPDEDYIRKQQHQQQQKGHRPTRVHHPYRFETVVAPPPPPPPTRQIQQQSLSQVLVAPPPADVNQPNLYESLNPGVINHELLPQLPPITTIRAPTTTTTRRSRPGVDNKESVQLLYVPLENLRKTQQIGQQSQNYYHQTQLPVGNEEVQKNRPQLLESIQQDFLQQALAAHKLQQQLQLQQQEELPKIALTIPTTTTTTPKPKKRKPHQPPLAVYMGKLGATEVNDVLRVLKNAKSITVQDSITSDSPQVFVGPYNLNPPEGYTKFPLPYISNVDGNRIEQRRVEELPFFVAPLSYKAPDGYSKIPLPSPHVGSVIVKEGLQHGKNSEVVKAQTTTTTTTPKDFISSPQIGTNFQQQFVPVFHEIKSNLQHSREYLPKYQHQSVESSTLNYEKYPQISNYEIETLPIINQNGPQVHRFSPTISTATPPPTTTTTTKPTTTEKLITTTTSQPENYNFVPFQPQNQYRLEVNPQQINHGFSQYELEQINRFIAENPEFHVSPVGGSDSPNSSPVPTQSPSASPQFVAAETPEFYPNPVSSSTLPSGTRSSSSSSSSPPSRFIAENSEFHQNPISGSTLQPLTLTSAVNSENYEILTKTRSKSSPSTPPPSRFLAETLEIQPDPISGSRIRLESHPTATGVGGDYDNRPSIPPPSSPHRFRAETPEFHSDAISGSTLGPASRPTTSTVANDDYEIVTKPRNRSRKRQRVRPTTRTTTTTTIRPVTSFNNEQYTVLEEFNIKPQITTTTTTTAPKYTTEIETVPANVYKLEPIFYQQQQDEQQHQQEIITDGPHYSPLIYNRGQISGTTSANSQLTGLLNDIQDQSVKSLLNPKLLIPTTEPFRISTTTTTEPVITTTTRRLRGRQRATTTPTPNRRVISRRRPSRLTTTTTTTTTTERTTTDFESSRAVSRQRFRTRGRPLTTELPENAQISENYHQQQHSNVFQEVSPQIEPQSYMQFEHTVNDEEVIKVKIDGDRDDHNDANNVKLNSEIEESKPVINVQINHPIEDASVKQLETTEKHPHTIQSGGAYHNHRYNQEDTERLASSQPIRGSGGGRARGRSRIPQTTPITTSTTSTTARLEQQTQKEDENEEEGEEFYGFIRPPNYNKPSPLILTTTQQQQQPRISIEEEQSSPTPSSVRFIGEIRPKYQATPTTTTTTTTQNSYEQPTVKSRPRIRIPQRRLNPQFNEIQTTPTTTTRRISVGRGRNRGHAHYQSSLGTSGEDLGENDGIEGGNYPVSYIKTHSFPPPTTTTTTTTSTEKPTFQITIDPDGYTADGGEENEEDQETYPSLYRPKWIQASAQALHHNQIVDQTQNITTTTTTMAENNRKRGAWKLVKKRPVVDQFEVAESQNYQSVLNLFDEITKISTTTTTTTTAEPTTSTTTTTSEPTTITESSLFDTIYSMFSGLNKSQQIKNETISTYADNNIVEKPETTTTMPPTFPDEITEATILATTTTDVPETTTLTTQSGGKKYDVEPWEMKEVKTSTSTEVSHETEICYKGRCVKTKDKN